MLCEHPNSRGLGRLVTFIFIKQSKNSLESFVKYKICWFSWKKFFFRNIYFCNLNKSIPSFFFFYFCILNIKYLITKRCNLLFALQFLNCIMYVLILWSFILSQYFTLKFIGFNDFTVN
jgi:hypothetical protein